MIGYKYPRISQIYRLRKMSFIYNLVLVPYDLPLQTTPWMDICYVVAIQGF